MTVDAGDRLDEEAAAALTRTFAQIDRWTDRIGRPPEPVTPGSELEVDDQITSPRCVSHLALTAVSAAVDHFHAASTLITAGRVIHANAQFSLLRAALENASTAVFLLRPDDRQVRIFRSLRVAWSDLVDHHNLLERMKQQPGKSRAAWKTELQNVAKSQNMTSIEVGQIASRAVSYSTIVEAAATEAFDEKQGSLALVIWMLNSGSAHGKQWASIAKIDKATLVATANPDVSQGRITAPTNQLCLSAAIVNKMIEKAWALYDQRRVV